MGRLKTISIRDPSGSLAECAVEVEGFLGLSCLGELRHPLRIGVVGVVVEPHDVAVVTPLLVPDVDDGDAGLAA